MHLQMVAALAVVVQVVNINLIKMKMFNIVILSSLLSFSFSCKTSVESELYIIPYGFKGKVNILFNQSKGEKPKYENNFRIYEIPSNGILLSQFKFQDGFNKRLYFSLDSLGNRIPLQVIKDEKGVKNNMFGVYRDGTTGVYGDSNDSKSIVYQEFYITNKDSLESYFNLTKQLNFEAKIKEITNYDF
jgi:hypothetical protein